LDLISNLDLGKLVPITYFGRRRVYSGKMENILDDNNTFDRMKMNKGRFGA
jgi:hypothetical protein